MVGPFSRRARATLLIGAALALPGSSAALAFLALAAPTGAAVTSAPTPTTPTPISSPAGGATSTAKLTVPTGVLLSTATTPVKCAAGPSGAITFAANSSDASAG